MPFELTFLSSINDDFGFIGASSVDTSIDILVGRPYGGTAILYRKCLNSVINLVKSDNSRVTAVILKVSIRGQLMSILMAYIYMPVASPDQDPDFEFICGSLNALIIDCNVNAFLLAGDFNCQASSPRYHFLLESLRSHKIICADNSLLNSESFTYVSDCHNTTSWIDHVFTNASLYSIIQDMSVSYDVIGSDHRPLSFCIFADVNLVDESIDDDKAYAVVPDWKASDEHHRQEFQFYLCQLLLSVSIPRCFQNNCTDVDHHSYISKYYSDIIACLQEASFRCIPPKRIMSSQVSVAGWNDHVDDKHQAARAAFMDWVLDGKPRNGHTYELMKITRAKFKLALRYCRANEERLRCDALAHDHLSNSNNFWKKVKKSANSKATKLANCIGTVVGETNIANMWKEHFAKLYNMGDSACAYDVRADVLNDDIDSPDVNEICMDDIVKAMTQLKSGKSCGPDGLCPEAFKFGGKMLAVHLKFLFNMFLAHSFLPECLTMTTLVPLLKNKSGDIADVNNYRAIALSNAASKIIESVMLERFQSMDQDSDPCQFGFKKNHSTTLGCSVLKNIINYYRG